MKFVVDGAKRPNIPREHHYYPEGTGAANCNGDVLDRPLAQLETDLAGKVINSSSFGLPAGVMAQLAKHAEYLHAEAASVSLEAVTSYGTMIVIKVKE